MAICERVQLWPWQPQHYLGTEIPDCSTVSDREKVVSATRQITSFISKFIINHPERRL